MTVEQWHNQSQVRKGVEQARGPHRVGEDIHSQLGTIARSQGELEKTLCVLLACKMVKTSRVKLAVSVAAIWVLRSVMGTGP